MRDRALLWFYDHAADWCDRIANMGDAVLVAPPHRLSRVFYDRWRRLAFGDPDGPPAAPGGDTPGQAAERRRDDASGQGGGDPWLLSDCLLCGQPVPNVPQLSGIGGFCGCPMPVRVIQTR